MKIALLLLALLLLAGVPAYFSMRELSPEEKLLLLQKKVEPQGGVVLQTELQGKKMNFLLLDCELFLLDSSGKEIDQTKVLRAGFYFWLTGCTGQSIRREGEYLMVNLENRAIGAGGGNTTGGLYRSKDGVDWEKRFGGKWRPVDEVQQ